MVFILASGAINGDSLVMESGVSRQAAERFPCIEQECARAIKTAPRAVQEEEWGLWVYGCAIVREPTIHFPGLALFQERLAATDGAHVGIIGEAIAMLAAYARKYPARIVVNIPGDPSPGNGGLYYKAAIPAMFMALPDNVIVCNQYEAV